MLKIDSILEFITAILIVLIILFVADSQYDLQLVTFILEVL